ncbi:hypothetical protein [Halobacteriovorax sp. RT-2-6]|uniref:hypothetical protein n=1 Tax=unclassified Halobacteriovorax TaxID=2639665 RepID=UPI00399A7893
MRKLKFDGVKLKNGSRTIANVSGDKIRVGTGSRTVLIISGDKVREGTGSRTLFNVKTITYEKGRGQGALLIWMMSIKLLMDQVRSLKRHFGFTFCDRH